LTDTNLPLQRFTVLDLTRARAGPTAARVFADWGANVITIEHPDRAGSDKSGFTGSRSGPDFQNLHRNKRSISLDLKNPEGRDVFFRLAEKADVIVENFRPDVKHRLGIDYDAIAKINPRIVYGSISGFGQSGPYQKRPGLDQIAQGMGGLMSITGLPGQGPVRVGIPITDLCAGMFLAQGILIALLDREVTGKGRWVHTSLLEAMIFMLDFQATRWLQNGDVPKQAGNNHPTGMPQGCYDASDAPILIAATGDELFSRLCKAIGGEHMLAMPEFAGDKPRSENRDQLNAEISKIIGQKPAAHWIDLLNTAGVPCGPVYSIDQVFADPQVEHLNPVRHVDSKRHGRLPVVRQPVNIGDAEQPETLRYPTPESGEHTLEVLKELGLDNAEIDRLCEVGATRVITKEIER
jgi:crotonobetainyl-CoA:carnitine CoA-transferase CaiB-like acyl-CoA transferase